MNGTSNQQELPSASSAGKQLLAVLFAVVFIWLAFRGCNIYQIWSYAKSANPFYLVLLCLSAIISHLLRSWRWIYLLEPVSDRKVRLWNSFCAVMFGYAVNVVIPRGGELVRLVSICKSENLPWAGVLPTMFIDRMLDIALLGLLLGTTLALLPAQLVHDMPWLVPGGVTLTAASIIGLLVLPFVGQLLKMVVLHRKVASFLPVRMVSAAEQLALEFTAGTRSLTNPRTYPAIAVLTPAIWLCYWLNYYLVVLAFGLDGRVNPLQCLIVFTIGSIGVLIPTPGSVGSTHFLVSQALIVTCGINKDLALSYATVVHLFCFVIIICIPAAICLLVRVLNESKERQKS